MENIGVVFGGRSVEHEVSIITGLQIIENMDREKFNPIPLYISKDGKMFSGENLNSITAFKDKNNFKGVEVFFKPEAGNYNLYTMKIEKGGLFSKSSENLEVYKKIDVIFPALHGTYGEDGAFQGLLDTLDIPYTGCGVLSGSVGMDKVVMKKVFDAYGINGTEYFYFYRQEWKDNRDKIIKKCEELGYNLFIKPANLGSSVGISKAKNREKLINAIDIASRFDRKILVEKAVEDDREINISVLGYENNLKVSVCEEPIRSNEFLSYEDKYVGNGKAKGMKGQSKKLPADLSDEIRLKIEEMAKESFRAIDGCGVVRIDFLVRENEVFVNEINTLPGSISFYLWEASGLKFKDLISEVIEFGKLRHLQRKENMTSIDSNLLNLTTYGAKL